ncbi:cell shape-determining protein MreC [Thalassotalea insulae]|uniref:Cell shape-determining protein MreC n=1 Tax=Thalassotalea insulae TaxID=2056778 RepID=A0ABQ6GR16_9GAMM|nr:rod shape-determining protein MreC [Thalassotalea insulae]GLX77857.1 cell shape-determining protein MreC [Thalassotalea insulae]
MNPIFKHGPSPQHRLVLVLFCSALLIFFDHKMNSFEFIRGYLQSMVSPLQYLATTPKMALDWAMENLVTRQKLIEENQKYKTNELIYHEQQMQLDILKQENDRLRLLLASPVRTDAKKMVAEILSVDSDPYSHQVVINRGANDGVFEGQAVIDDQGIVGQILHVGTISSRVLLITDVTHALPVRIKRNGIRLIANGTGNIDRLAHNHVPHSTDIRVGDLLVTSGLGGKYPEGYPVAKVSAVRQDESRPFSLVQSEPVARINRLRYLLLLWPEKPNKIFSSKDDLVTTKETN